SILAGSMRSSRPCSTVITNSSGLIEHRAQDRATAIRVRDPGTCRVVERVRAGGSARVDRGNMPHWTCPMEHVARWRRSVLAAVAEPAVGGDVGQLERVEVAAVDDLDRVGP